MKNRLYLLSLSCFLFGLFLLFSPVRVLAVSCADCVQIWHEQWFQHCLVECYPACASEGWTSASWSDCQSAIGNPQNVCCTNYGGCPISGCGGISQWTWCYGSGCQKKANPFQEGMCDFQYQYSFSECGATDTCEAPSTYLKAGLCSTGGCSVGGNYKACCDDAGNLENCNGGQYSGTCPHRTVMCGWGNNPDCGPAACLSGMPVPTTPPGVPTPTTPPPVENCTGDCNWWQNQYNNCGWCTNSGACDGSGMCNKRKISVPSCGECSLNPGLSNCNICCSVPGDIRCCGCQGNPPPCTPNCSCANNTCIGQTCPNGCGGRCNGLKCCKTPPTSPTCRTPSGGTIIYDSTAPLVWRAPTSWGSGCPDSRSYALYLSQTNPPTFRADVPYTQTTYSATNLTNGTYYWQIAAVNNDQTTFSGTCDFIISADYDPWWQTTDGDVHAQGKLTSLIGSCSSSPYLSIAGAGDSPGVVTWGGGESPDLDEGIISATNWQANDPNRRPQVGFDYLANRLNVDKSQEFSGTDLPGNNGIYYTERSSFELQGGNVGTKKIIIFAAGDVKVMSPITVDQGGFFALITKGKITFDSNAIRAEGFYLTDQTIDTSTIESGFSGYGSFVAWEGFTFNHNVRKVIGGVCSPGENFYSRPDLYISAPKEFLFAPSFFQEMAP